jgi:hypothetical protein
MDNIYTGTNCCLDEELNVEVRFSPGLIDMTEIYGLISIRDVLGQFVSEV